MKVLLDEHLSPTVAELLRRRGCDAVAISDRADLRGAPDEHVLAVASDEDRALVTNDVKDFRPIGQRRVDTGARHAGLIFIPRQRDRSRSSLARLTSALELVIEKNPDGLANSEVWVRADR